MDKLLMLTSYADFQLVVNCGKERIKELEKEYVESPWVCFVSWLENNYPEYVVYLEEYSIDHV